MYWEFIPWTSLLLLGPYWVDFNPLPLPISWTKFFVSWLLGDIADSTVVLCTFWDVTGSNCTVYKFRFLCVCVGGGSKFCIFVELSLWIAQGTQRVTLGFTACLIHNIFYLSISEEDIVVFFIKKAIHLNFFWSINSNNLFYRENTSFSFKNMDWISPASLTSYEFKGYPCSSNIPLYKWRII